MLLQEGLSYRAFGIVRFLSIGSASLTTFRDPKRLHGCCKSSFHSCYKSIDMHVRK